MLFLSDEPPSDGGCIGGYRLVASGRHSSREPATPHMSFRPEVLMNGMNRTNQLAGGPRSRREFLADVGRGVLVAAVGSGLAVDLGLATTAAAAADEAGGRPAPAGDLAFGPLE